MYHRGMTSVSPRPLVPVGIAQDEATAERWADALGRAGIDAEIRIEDGIHLGPGGSAYGALAGGRPFVYPVLVSRVQRRAARRALAELEALDEDALNEEHSISGAHLARVIAVLAGTLLLVLLLALVRGDL